MKAAPASVEAWIVYAALIGLIGAAFMVDPWAHAAFEAPKWLVVRLAAILGVFSLLYFARSSPCLSLPDSSNARWATIAIYLLAFVGGCAVLAAFRSEHGVTAWEFLAAMALGALWLFIGASRALEGHGGLRVLRVFFWVVAINAGLSILQLAGLSLPFEVAAVGGRFSSGALLGNEGYVALASALMAAAAMGLLCASGISRRSRSLAAAALILAISTIALNRQLTSGVALVAALVVILAARFGRRRWLLLFFIGVAGLVMCAAVPVLRSVTWAQLPGIDAATYQRATTYRLGAWASALEMIETSPWLGQGPGAYSQESSARRFPQELRAQTRLVQPLGATFVAAHQEPLQWAAELGIPAAVATLIGFAVIVSGLLGRGGRVVDPERLMLLGVLGVGAVSSLAWFPLQIPLTAVVLLLACGRAWRIGATADRSSRE